MKLARRVVSHVRRLRRRGSSRAVPDGDAVQPLPIVLTELKAADFADLAYQVILNRRMDPGGYEAYVPLLESGRMSRYQFVLTLFNSLEFKAPQISETLHRSR